MPALSPVQQQLIDIFASKEDFVNLAIIHNNCCLHKKEIFPSLWNNLCEIALGNPETAQRLLQEFNPNDLDNLINYERLSADQTVVTSAKLAEILRKIQSAIVQGKKQSQALVPTTGNQTAAITLLWCDRFLTTTYEIFKQRHTFPKPVPQTLIDRYASYLQYLHTIALGTTTGQEVAFLEENYCMTAEFVLYLNQLPDVTDDFKNSDPYFKKWMAFFLPLIFYFKNSSFLSRSAGAFISLLINPLLFIIFWNPIKLLLSSIANKKYLLGFLAATLYPLTLIFVIPSFTLLNYQNGFSFTFKGFAGIILTDFHYTLLSFLIIGLGVTSALTLILFPPAVTFLLSLPLLSILSGISLPWLAVIAGATVGLLTTLITAGITWIATREANVAFSAADFRNDETAPLTASTEYGQSPEAQAALAVKNRSPFNILPNVIQVTTQSEKVPSLLSTIYKNKGARYPEYPFYIVYDDHQIYITCSSKECTTGKIKFSFLSEPIVVENGQCKTALPPYIKFIPDQYQAEFTDLVIQVDGHPHANKTLYKAQPFTFGPFRIFNDGKQIRVECSEKVNGCITIGSLLFHLKNGRHDSDKEHSVIKIIPYQPSPSPSSAPAAVLKM